MKNWKNALPEETVCYCLNIDKQTIANGAQTLKDIQKETKACTGSACKTTNPSGVCCSSDIKELLKIFADSISDLNSDSCCCCSE